MTSAKLSIPGRAARIVGKMIIVRTGDTVDYYNTEYYRIAEEAQSGVEKAVKRG